MRLALEDVATGLVEGAKYFAMVIVGLFLSVLLLALAITPPTTADIDQPAATTAPVPASTPAPVPAAAE